MWHDRWRVFAGRLARVELSTSKKNPPTGGLSTAVRLRSVASCTAAALGATAPVFADSWHGGERNYRDDYSRSDHRDHRVTYIRGVEQRPVVVVQRSYAVERLVPVYYPGPAPQPSIGLGAMIGAAIGTIFYDNRQ